jgi:3-oxoacyl-[acyl-carrier protein] reductase
MDLGLGGKIAMISGASRGLGLATARTLGAEGARLSICARGADGLTKAAEELRTAGAEVLAIVADQTDPKATERWVKATIERFGKIDLLVNNAGGAKLGGIFDLGDADWSAAFELNLFGPARLARLCAAEMAKHGGGAIINVSSVYGRESGGPISYNASKAALNSFNKMLARELAPQGIRVNAVAPGSIIYPGGTWERLFRENPEFERDFISHDFPAGRLGRPEEVAYAVAMLASPRASWIVGACLPVDGAQGRSIA